MSLLGINLNLNLCIVYSDYKKTSLKGYMETFWTFLKGIDDENKAALRQERLGMLEITAI